MVDGRKIIESMTGTRAGLFAYPSGAYNEALSTYIRENETWNAAVTVEPGLVSAEANPATLPRNSVDSEVRMRQFKMKITSSVKYYINLKSFIQ